MQYVWRFDSALRLNVHLHVLALDGVYLREAGGALGFHQLPEPNADEVADVAERTARRIQRLLERLGLRPDPALCASEDEQQQLWEAAVNADPQTTEDHPALLACYSAATQGLDLFAERAGQP